MIYSLSIYNNGAFYYDKKVGNVIYYKGICMDERDIYYYSNQVDEDDLGDDDLVITFLVEEGDTWLL